MKIYLSLIITTLLLAGNLNAQHFNLGVKGGLNVYNIKNSNSANSNPLTNFHLGMLAHIHQDRQWALQPEVTYSVQGFKNNSGGGTTTRLGYLNVPILLQYMFDNGFRLQAGPQIGFLTRAKSEINNTKIDVKNNFKPVDFGLSAGIGYIHPPSGIGVDARYNFGLSNVNKTDVVKSTNNGFQLGLFYLLNHQ